MKHEGKITLLSPLSHNSDESVGIDTKFRRMDIKYEGKRFAIPFYSGNAIRGVLRRIAASFFCSWLSIHGKPKISDKLYYSLFTGGSLEKGSVQNYIEIGERRKLRANIPMLSVFGSAIQNMILPGKIKIGIALPISKETQELTGIPAENSIWESLMEIFYTRRDGLEDKESKEDIHQMKYTIECLAPGVQLQHSIMKENLTEVEESCFNQAMAKMVEDGMLGGKTGIGHGSVKMEYSPKFEMNSKYSDYLDNNTTTILDYVNDLELKLNFKGDKKKKGKEEDDGSDE